MSDERLLILETSTRRAVVALACGATLLETHYLEEPRRHARDLAPVSAELLRKHAWKARDLHAVIVTRGPGSYTGLRVGLMAAKTLSYATGCALIALDTFPVVAQQAPSGVVKVDVLGDAQQDKIYVQSFVRNGSEMQAVDSLRIVSVGEWLSKRESQTWVTGPGVSAKARQLPDGLPLIEEDLRDPRPATLLEMGRRQFESGERADVFAVEPIYLRASAAEEQWDKLHGGTR